MNQRIACLLLSLISFAAARAEEPSDREAIVTRTGPTAMAVARLLCTEKWSLRADEILKASSAAETMGDQWTPNSDAWKRAKAAVMSRITRIIDTYAESGELARDLASVISTRLSDADAKSIAAALDGPAGPSVLRFEATTLFVSTTMADDPKSPSPGQPGWMDQMRQVRAVFETSIGADVPPGDPTQGEALMVYMSGPSRQPFMQCLSVAVGKATTAIDGAVQLDLFDAGEAIEKAIQQAVTETSK